MKYTKETLIGEALDQDLSLWKWGCTVWDARPRAANPSRRPAWYMGSTVKRS